MKTTAVQRNVIRLMRKGWMLGYVPRVIGKRGVLYKGTPLNYKKLIYIQWKTFKALENNKLLKYWGKQFEVKLFTLSEIGQTINIKLKKQQNEN